MCEIMLYVSENICESTGIKQTTSSCENTAGFVWREKKYEYFHSMRKSRDQIVCFSFFLSLVIFCYLACCYFVLCYVGFAFRLNPLSTNLHKDILHRNRPFVALSRQILQKKSSKNEHAVSENGIHAKEQIEESSDSDFRSWSSSSIVCSKCVLLRMLKSFKFTR